MSMAAVEDNDQGWARPNETRFSKHFFKREDDGSVRLRMRFSPEEASLIEEAAGDTPLLVYIHRVLKDRAEYHVRAARRVQRQQRDTERREQE